MNPNLFNLPLILIGAGIVLLLAAIRVLIQQRRIVEVVPQSQLTIEVPAKWDETEIKNLLLRYQNQPSVLSHAVSSIRARLIMNQDQKTAQARLRMISGVIDLFKLNKELQGLLHDLHLAEKEFAIKQIEAAIRLEDAETRQKSERKLRQLRAERDELVVKKEIAKTQQDINALRNPSTPQAEPTPEEKRSRQKQDCERRIAQLKAEKQQALKLEDEEERLRKVNAIDAALEREYERWAGLV